MHDSPSGRDDRPMRRPADGTIDPTRLEALESIVVRYERRPDRCTITPRECPEDERVTTWLTVDVDALVDLKEIR